MGVTVLLDTHALLWSLMDPNKLSETARLALVDADSELMVSSASAWELAIKHKLGKLKGAEGVLKEFEGNLDRLQAEVLPITPQHALRAGRLPLHHRDPFDRMLVAQAQIENVPLVTQDEAFDAYDVSRLW